MILTNVGLPVSPDFQKESSKRFPIYRPVPFLQIQAGKLPTALNHSAASQTSSSYRTQCADTNGTPELNCEWGPHTKSITIRGDASTEAVTSIIHHKSICEGLSHFDVYDQGLRWLGMDSYKEQNIMKKKERKRKAEQRGTTVPRSILSLAFQKALRVFGSEKLLGLLEMKHIGLNSQFC